MEGAPLDPKARRERLAFFSGSRVAQAEGVMAEMPYVMDAAGDFVFLDFWPRYRELLFPAALPPGHVAGAEPPRYSVVDFARWLFTLDFSMLALVKWFLVLDLANTDSAELFLRDLGIPGCAGADSASGDHPPGEREALRDAATAVFGRLGEERGSLQDFARVCEIFERHNSQSLERRKELCKEAAVRQEREREDPEAGILGNIRVLVWDLLRIG